MASAHMVDDTATGRQASEPWAAPRPRLSEPRFQSAGASGSAGAPATGQPRAIMRTVREEDALLQRVAQSRVSVLITGETGVGKDVLARRLHELSPRAARPFVPLNCAAISDGLLESELFGHQRGAFTGADRDKPGLIEAADGGTLFLDEVGELSPGAQAKLLRVIETRAVLRLGALLPHQVDVRFLAATNRAVDADVAIGRFRADLLFRLDGIRLNLPPLRERPAQILPAAEQFLAELAARDGLRVPCLSDAARRELSRHSWSGNFRELRNVIERAALLCQDSLIEPRDLMLVERAITVGSPLGAPVMPAVPERQGSREAIDEGIDEGIDAATRRDGILAALKACAGNQTRAAAMLGVSRRTLINWLERHAIARPRKRVLKVLSGTPASPRRPNTTPP